MIFAIDIGNTNIVFGCVDDNDEVVLFERSAGGNRCRAHDPSARRH